MRAAFGKRMQPALSFSPRLQCVSRGALQRQRGDDVICAQEASCVSRGVLQRQRGDDVICAQEASCVSLGTLLYQLDGDATCVVAGPVGFGSRFLVAWEAASRGWKRCCGGLAKRVSGYLENCLGGGGMRLSGPGRGARLRSD